MMKRSFEGEVMDSEVDKDLENLEQNESFSMNSMDNVGSSSDQYRNTSLKLVGLLIERNISVPPMWKAMPAKRQWYDHTRKIPFVWS